MSDPLAFSLEFPDDQALLGLVPVRLGGLLRVEQLELEVPGLRFPFESSIEQLQTRRTNLRRLHLVVEEEEAVAWLRGRDLAHLGLEAISLRFTRNLAIVSGRARVGDRTAPVTIRLKVGVPAGEPEKVSLEVVSVRQYAYLPVPSSLLGVALLAGLLGEGGDSLVLRGVSSLVVSPLVPVLRDLLPARGWRLPSKRGAHVRMARLGGGRLEVIVEGSGPSPPALVVDDGLTAAEELLRNNRFEAALAAFREVWGRRGLPKVVASRCSEHVLGILASTKKHWDEAASMAQRALMASSATRRPVVPRLVIAMIAAEHGQFEIAARIYVELVDEAEKLEEYEDADAASLRAADLLLRARDPAAASRALERVAGQGRMSSQIAQLLADCYTAQGRWEDLAALERQRLSLARDAGEQAQGHLRLASLWLDRMGDGARAREELELAVGLAPREAEAWFTLARAHHSLGEEKRAIESLDRYIALAGDHPERRVEAHLLAARWQGEMRRDYASALDRVRAAADLLPDQPEVLVARARLLALDGQTAEAHAALDRAIAAVGSREVSDDTRADIGRAAWLLRRWEAARAAWEPLFRRGVAPRVERGLQLGWIARRQGDLKAAREFFSASLDAGAAGSSAVQAYDALAQLTELQGNFEATLYIEMDAAEDPQTGESGEARARRLMNAADLVQRLGRGEQARDLFERALAQDPAHLPALDALESLARAAGDAREIAAIIDRKVAATRDRPSEQAALLARLAQLQADGGDQPGARETFRRILVVDPQNSLAGEWLARDGKPRPARRVEAVAEAPVVSPLPTELEGGADVAGAALLRAQAGATSSHEEASLRLFEAGTLSERLGDENQAISDFEAALSRFPNHAASIEAIADLAYRRRDVARARHYYRRLITLPSRLGPPEIWWRLGELAEVEEDFDEAGACYHNAIEANPSLVDAHEAIARLALRRDDKATVFAALKAMLALLPLDEFERITELRQRLGTLALALGDRVAARNYYELVLAQQPERIEALVPLADLYFADGDWEDCVAMLQRIGYVTVDPRQRASVLHRQGEILRLHLGRQEAAERLYLKAADLDPTHAPTLRRLIPYYLTEGDGAAVSEIVESLESRQLGPDEVAPQAGFGLILAGEGRRARRYLEGLPVPVLAAALSAVRVIQPVQLDRLVHAAALAIGGGEERALEQLASELDRRLVEDPVSVGARLIRGRIAEQRGDTAQARIHFVVAAFVDPRGAAVRLLQKLPVAAPVFAPPEETNRDPLARALHFLGRKTIGITELPDEETEQIEIVDRIAERLALGKVEIVEREDLPEPAWAEASRPVRLLVRPEIIDDEPALRFSAERAFHLLSCGLSLVHGRSPDDVVDLLGAAAELIEPPEPGQREPANPTPWRVKLRPLLPLSHMTTDERVAVSATFLQALTTPDLAARLARLAVDEARFANQAALAAGADLAAALRSLAPTDEAGSRRIEDMLRDPTMHDLLVHASKGGGGDA